MKKTIKIRCPRCDRVNDVPRDNKHDHYCGACGTRLITEPEKDSTGRYTEFVAESLDRAGDTLGILAERLEEGAATSVSPRVMLIAHMEHCINVMSTAADLLRERGARNWEYTENVK